MAKQRLTDNYHFTIWILFLCLGSIAGAHECGPESITVGVGEDKTWIIINDEPGLTTTYTITTMGDTSIVGISPTQPFNTNGDGVYTFTGKKAGQTTFAIEWVAKFFGNTIAAGTCTVTVIVKAQTGTVTGMKYNDLNGNGMRDVNEPGIEGWTIEAVKTGTTKEFTAVTDANGVYRLILPPDNYYVTEAVRVGWVQTAPASIIYPFTITAGQSLDGFDFGNTQTYGVVVGFKYNDLDGDGFSNVNEPGIEGWIVEAFSTETGEKYTAVTTTKGRFQLILPPGNYIVREEQRVEWAQTDPNLGEYRVEVKAGTTIVPLFFGNSQAVGVITGQKFNDLDGDGFFDSNEVGIERWIIKAVSTETEEEYLAVTDTNGIYRLKLPSGNYFVGEEQRPASGFVQTLPISFGYEDVIIKAGQSLDGLNFGNSKNVGAITGIKFNDKNGNGLRDDDENGLAGWIIEVANAKGPIWQAVTDSVGFYRIVLPPDTDYSVQELGQPGWMLTYPTGQSITDYFHFTVAAGQTIDHLDFGNHRYESDRRSREEVITIAEDILSLFDLNALPQMPFSFDETVSQFFVTEDPLPAGSTINFNPGSTPDTTLDTESFIGLVVPNKYARCLDGWIGTLPLDPNKPVRFEPINGWPNTDNVPLFDPYVSDDTLVMGTVVEGSIDEPNTLWDETPAPVNTERICVLLVSGKGRNAKEQAVFNTDLAIIKSNLTNEALGARIAPSSIFTVMNPTVDTLAEELSNLITGCDVIYFFYSGHGNKGGLSLENGETFPYDRLREQLLRATAATLNIGIDACRSGAALPLFQNDERFKQKDVTIITSSTAENSAYTRYTRDSSSGELLTGASVFGLNFFLCYGDPAAESDGNPNQISLAEAFAWYRIQNPQVRVGLNDAQLLGNVNTIMDSQILRSRDN